MVSSLGAVRMMLGEKAALMAYKSFVRSVLMFGCEVMVWDRVGFRKRMDVVQRKALRAVLGLDVGSRNELLYGETGEDGISAEAEWMAVRYGEQVTELDDERLVKKVLGLRKRSGKDRWVKYVQETMESMGREGGYQWGLRDLGVRNEEGRKEDWKGKVIRREEEAWRRGMERTRGSMEVYKEVVRKRGEMKRWEAIDGETRAWWRRFRGGMFVGRRRENRWKDARCLFCKGENGGMRHVVLECRAQKMEVARKAVLSEMGGKLEGSEAWESLGEAEKLWCALGKEGMGVEVRGEGAAAWRRAWAAATAGTTTTATAGTTTTATAKIE
jgi:hypothetical protein